MEQNIKRKTRILQVNLDGEGGAFSLMYQMQGELLSDYIFDFYWMGKFRKNAYTDALKKNGSRFFEANLRKNRLIGHFLTPFLFYKFLKAHKYDVVHINADTAFKLLIYAKPAKKAGCSKVILHSHSSGINGKFKLLKYVMHLLARPFLKKNSDVYLSCSDLASEWMFKSDNRAVEIIKNGVDIEKFKFSDDTRSLYRQKLLAENKIVIGMVGNLSYQKNPEFLIETLALLPKDMYMVVFVGDGENRKNVEELVNAKGLSERVVFYGQTSEVNNLLNAFDIFAMPSRFEGLPVSGVEAQTNGLKCIFSDKITSEIGILTSCEFLPIGKSYEIWADRIKNATFDDRACAHLIVSEHGFDIYDSAKRLSNIYAN